MAIKPGLIKVAIRQCQRKRVGVGTVSLFEFHPFIFSCTRPAYKAMLYIESDLFSVAPFSYHQRHQNDSTCSARDGTVIPIMFFQQRELFINHHSQRVRGGIV